MLYPNKNRLDKELFRNPTKEYRGAPFWAWNCAMNRENIARCVETLKAMGMGGGHMHVRTGLSTPYLEKEFMELVRFARDEMEDKGLLAYLYDEDRWPSGAAGGLVTKDHAYRMRFLVVSPVAPTEGNVGTDEMSSSGKAVHSSERKELARYAVRLEGGRLAGYRRLAPGCSELSEGERLWYAWLEISGDNPWFNNEAYLNTMDRKAVERFIEVTHEAYFREFGGDFGKMMPSIFTDEPQMTRKTNLRYPEEEGEVVLSWTDDLEETFVAAYGHSLLDHVPELVWELPEGQVSVYRYEYHDHAAERFCEAFSDTVGDWCRQHGIRMTGHVMSEESLLSQSTALSEAMRFYRSMDIPGIDMLCDNRELSTAKQAQSAVHQYGREGMMSELYGVTNWDFDFRGHKLQGDWQAALGVTLRVPHLFWTSMEGEAKRDYPASIGFQSPWYREYESVETYFARVNTCMTRGKAVERIGVIHPIESYWLLWGPETQTAGIREEMDRHFHELIDMLLYGLQDFDLISESLLPAQTKGRRITKITKTFPVGEMNYDVILVPGCLTLRSTTVDLLNRFREAGGRVIFVGKTPYLESARPSERVKELVRGCEQLPLEAEDLLPALEPVRFVDVRRADGGRCGSLICQHRTEGDTDWLFLAHAKRPQSLDLPVREELTISLSGSFRVTEYRAADGTIHPISARHEDGKTVFRAVLYDEDSLLLRLDSPRGGEADGTAEAAEAVKAASAGEAVGSVETAEETFAGVNAWLPLMNTEGIRLSGEAVPVTLEEPNVLLLDQAEYRFDGGEWQGIEEVLRIDNILRGKLGLPQRMEHFAQPWVTGDRAREEEMHSLSLRMRIVSEAAVENAWLGIEDADSCRIIFNGREAEQTEGFYVDPAIQKVRLGAIREGENLLEVEIPFNSAANVEAMYLLGDFGVRVQGAKAVVTAPVRTLSFGDITVQGLPFYGGNLTYHVPLILEEEKRLLLHTGKFRAPALAAGLDGERKGLVAYSPYTVDLGPAGKGKHTVDITMYGSRINTFGIVHNCYEPMIWFGPNSWRTTGDAWAYEYQLKPVGVLKSPVLL